MYLGETPRNHKNRQVDACAGYLSIRVVVVRIHTRTSTKPILSWFCTRPSGMKIDRKPIIAAKQPPGCMKRRNQK